MRRDRAISRAERGWGRMEGGGGLEGQKLR